jgi:hypothetical protein
MIDREKVVKGLTVCTKPGTRGCFYDIKECPYDNNGCRMALMRDALVLLNEDCHNCKLECLLQKYDELKEKYDALLKEQEAEKKCCRDCEYFGNCHDK